MKKQKDFGRLKTERLLLRVLVALFVLSSVFAIVYQAVNGETMFMMRGFLFPLFLLIVPVFRRLGLGSCYRLMSMLYAFSLFAFTYGCVLGGFTGNLIMDKVSHFLSGIVFTVFGYCLYFFLAGRQPGGIRHKALLSSSYALCFSAFIGVMWEVCEFLGFIFTGHDSQNHLTTGVFDTMQDLICCLVGSVISVASFALYRYTNRKLMTPAIVSEFYEEAVEKNKRGKPAGKEA